MKLHIAKLYFPQNCQNFHFWNKYANGQFISTTDTKHIYVVHSDCSVYGAFGIFIDHYQHISSQEQQKLQKKKKKKILFDGFTLCVLPQSVCHNIGHHLLLRLKDKSWQYPINILTVKSEIQKANLLRYLKKSKMP